MTGTLDPVFDRVSNGVLVHPFGDGAVAADLVIGRAHLLSAGAAWLLTSEARSVEELVGDLPAGERQSAADRILDALATLRTLGLIGRHEPFEHRLRPVGSGHEPPGSHRGRSHQVLAERVAFRSDDASLLEQIDEFLGSGTGEGPTLCFDIVPGDDGTLDLYTESDWHFLNREQFFFQLPAVLNDYAVRSHGALALHAGAVRTPSGRSLVLLGHMDAGKSTLTAACVAAGCDYFSDETIGIGSDRSLVGYPKPITIDRSTHEVLGLAVEPEPHVLPTALRGDVERLAGAASIDEILLVRYDPDAPEVLHERLAPPAALQGLCAHTLNLARMGEAGLATLCDVAETVSVSRFVHPGVEAAVPRLLDR